MQKVFGIILGVCFLTACAGTEADLEKAKYLLGKGGKANAVSAVAILEPLKTDADAGNISGNQLLEIYRLYAGAKMGAAGFDSVNIVSALLFSEDSALLSSISDSIGDALEADAATSLQNASDALASAISSTAYSAATTEDRVKRGLQFQSALVDMLKSIRILIETSGFNETEFSSENCRNSLAVGAELNAGVGSMYDARDRLSRDADGVNLGSDNDLVTALTAVLTGIDPDGNEEVVNGTDLETLCDYLEQQRGAQ